MPPKKKPGKVPLPWGEVPSAKQEPGKKKVGETQKLWGIKFGVIFI